MGSSMVWVNNATENADWYNFGTYQTMLLIIDLPQHTLRLRHMGHVFLLRQK